MSVHMPIHTCLSTCVHTCLCTCLYACEYTYTCTCILTCLDTPSLPALYNECWPCAARGPTSPRAKSSSSSRASRGPQILVWPAGPNAPILVWPAGPNAPNTSLASWREELEQQPRLACICVRACICVCVPACLHAGMCLCARARIQIRLYFFWAHCTVLQVLLSSGQLYPRPLSVAKIDRRLA